MLKDCFVTERKLEDVIAGAKVQEFSASPHGGLHPLQAILCSLD